MKNVSYVTLEDAVKEVVPYMRELKVPVYRIARAVVDFSPKGMLLGVVYGLMEIVSDVREFLVNPKNYMEYRRELADFKKEQDVKYLDLGLETKLERKTYALMARIGANLFAYAENDMYSKDEFEELVSDTMYFVTRNEGVILERSNLDMMVQALCENVYGQLEDGVKVVFLDSLIISSDFGSEELFVQPLISEEEI